MTAHGSDCACRHDTNLERLAIEALFSKQEESVLEPSCPDCRAAYRKWKKYYGLLKQELRRPISAKVKAFVEDLERAGSPIILN